jgi:outer membrane protein assembly factor BamB
LSVRDGSTLWQSEDVGPSYGPPTVSDGIVYFGATRVIALHASDGTLLWRAPETRDNTQVFSTARVLQGVVFVAGGCTNSIRIGFNGCEGRILALSARDGSLFWSTSLSSTSTPIV